MLSSLLCFDFARNVKHHYVLDIYLYTEETRVPSIPLIANRIRNFYFSLSSKHCIEIVRYTRLTTYRTRVFTVLSCSVSKRGNLATIYVCHLSIRNTADLYFDSMIDICALYQSFLSKMYVCSR